MLKLNDFETEDFVALQLLSHMMASVNVYAMGNYGYTQMFEQQAVSMAYDIAKEFENERTRRQSVNSNTSVCPSCSGRGHY
jgi:hypothetical protein